MGLKTWNAERQTRNGGGLSRRRNWRNEGASRPSFFEWWDRRIGVPRETPSLLALSACWGEEGFHHHALGAA